MKPDAMLEQVIDLAAEKLADRAEAALTPAQLEALRLRALEKRIGRLTLEEAAKFLACPSRASLLEVCRVRRIPIIRESRKRTFIRLADIEAADARERAVPGSPTVIHRAAA